ncbi:alkylmercury lyase [Gillisia sp. Hel1_33_143]|uniref:organomercurial lyase n=1 Tax=Gillisia sp. Hel1_33_143 TaxID=1336796 RepID=UPI00087C5F7A|nr:organomercurial lyase [Gillisia sp. Hel1_33_143]SDR68181.1 alkylmercury lyase [Gillisia sp. Hel1_33_143]
MKSKEITFWDHKSINGFEQLLEELDLPNSDKVYWELLKGKPLHPVLFAQLMDVPIYKAHEIIKLYGETNRDGNITGYVGLSLNKTAHQLNFDNKSLYAWCAMDTILLPRYLMHRWEIISKDPITGNPVKLSISDNLLEWTKPVPIFISWIEKADSCDIRSSFCQYSNFFENELSANKWRIKNPTGNIYPVEQFFSNSSGSKCC